MLDNITDPNTTDDAREVTLTVKVKPQEDNRAIAAVTITCKSKLGHANPCTTIFYMSRDRAGKTYAREYDPKQMEIPMEAPDRDTQRFVRVNGGATEKTDGE